jgi:THO complex subunit 2
MSPADEEMEGIRQAFINSTTSRSGPNNALANSVLIDDEPSATSSAKDTEPTGPPAKPPPEQRIQLLQALLSLGDTASAQYFLAKYPWTAQSHPAIADLILRLIGYALEDVFRDEVPGLETVDEDIDAQSSGSVAKEVVPTLYAPSPPETPTKVFRFFYPDWRIDSERWTSAAEVLEKGLRWFSLIRGMGGRAGAVMAKICRIGTKHFAALKAAKETELGFAPGTTKRDEMRQVEVSQINQSIAFVHRDLLHL